MRSVKPHELFRLDFDQLIEEGKRQELLLTANIGEHILVKNMHEYFADIVLPMIVSDDWVFEAANRFASDYAIQCFRLLRSTGMEVYQAQQALMNVKIEVIEIMKKAKSLGYIIPFYGSKELEKASDFITLLQINKMPKSWKSRVIDLHSRAIDREGMHVYTALRGIRDMYEISVFCKII